MDRFHVELTSGAEDDLEALHSYLRAHRSAADADALLDLLSQRIDTLERFPARGNVPKELAALGMHEFRQVLVGRYRVIYRIVGSKVFVLLIAEGRRDMQALLEHRLLGR